MDIQSLTEKKELYIPDDMHEQMILQHYTALLELQTAIELGHAQEAYDLVLNALSATYQPQDSHTLKIANFQKQLNTLNTVCVLSVSRFNLNPLYLYSVAFHYNTMLEKVTTREQCQNLILNMLNDYCSLSLYSGKEKYSDSVQQAIWRITADPSHPLSLPSLAHSLGMSPASLSRKFHHETGKTLSQYHTAFRIFSAQRYLLEERMTITQVAYKVGFNDTSYFSRVFAKQTGCSPTDYIRQFRNAS